MAGKAELAPHLEPKRSPNDSAGPLVEDFDPKTVKKTDDPVFQKAAELFGLGYTHTQVARLLVRHLVPNWKGRPEEQNLSQARSKLKRWTLRQDFRDLVYKKAVVELDMSTPGILKGVAKKAQRGRVDAARLALEVTGRHNPKGDAAPTQVMIQFSGVPRSQAVAPTAEEIIDGEAVEEE